MAITSLYLPRTLRRPIPYAPRDHLPEQAFYMVGGIEEAVEKAKKMGVAA